MQRLEVSGAVRPLYGSLGYKGLTETITEKVRFTATLDDVILWHMKK